MEANIRRVQSRLSALGVGNRPHIKTHKIPAIGKLQMAAGAMGITCQKLGEVEVFADAGVADDVLLTYNILGAAKAERLMAVNRRIKRLTVSLDNEVVARGLSEAAAARGPGPPLRGGVRHRHGPHRRADARAGLRAGARRPCGCRGCSSRAS